MAEKMVEGGKRGCPYCLRDVIVLCDIKAKWDFCPECKRTLWRPKGKILTTWEEVRLGAFKVQRITWDGFMPRPQRSEKELGWQA